ncbi:MAG: hypothetical protein ABIO39_07405 [Caulobacteraceae bacterium]
MARGKAVTAASANSNPAKTFFFLQFCSLILLQKVGLPAGAAQISIQIPLLYASIAYAAFFLNVEVSLIRLIIYCIFFTVALFSQMVSGQPFSITSFEIVLALYLPFIFVWRMSREDYLECMKPFQNLMLLGGAMVLLQVLWQVGTHYRSRISIEPLIPAALRLQGYLYEAPIHWGASFYRANGFFFLEPSSVSSFLACAFIIEVSYFQRPKRMLFYIVSMFATLAATGVVMLLIASPFLLMKLTPRMRVLAAAVGLLAIPVVLATGLGDVFLSRTTELSNPGTSGSQRVAAPAAQILDILPKPNILFTGQGAGNVDNSQSSVWGVVKLLDEYGGLTAITFMIFLIFCMAGSSNMALFWPLFIVYNFTGGYLSYPPLILLIMLLCSSAVVIDTPDRRPALRAVGRRREAPAHT